MSLSEYDLWMQELQIPEIVKPAVQNAYLDALKAGLSVHEVIDDQLFKTTPDGKKTLIKELPHGRPVRRGQTIILT